MNSPRNLDNPHVQFEVTVSQHRKSSNNKSNPKYNDLPVLRRHQSISDHTGNRPEHGSKESQRRDAE